MSGTWSACERGELEVEHLASVIGLLSDYDAIGAVIDINELIGTELAASDFGILGPHEMFYGILELVECNQLSSKMFAKDFFQGSALHLDDTMLLNVPDIFGAAYAQQYYSACKRYHL